MLLRDRRLVVAFCISLSTVLSWASLDQGLADEFANAAEYSAIDPPRFEVLLRPERIWLAAHTRSLDHERALLQTTSAIFSGRRAEASFRPLGTAPDHWAATSIAVLDALSAVQSANVLLSDDRLRIHGVGGNDWPDKFELLRGQLGDSITLEVDMIIPDDSIQSRALCSRAFTEQTPGPVAFEESLAVLRSSAKLALDRIISLADACRDSTLSITGHTDSSGDESANRNLSLARANAVAEYIADRGIAEERIVALGAGSSQPVAANETRYGRSLNRRIEIHLHQDTEPGDTTPD